WIADELDELGAETPTMITSTVDEPAYEEILELEPDLILAAYSGITEEQYELLSDIAPTVASPDEPWVPPGRRGASGRGRARGRAARGTPRARGQDRRGDLGRGGHLLRLPRRRPARGVPLRPRARERPGGGRARQR